MITRHCHVCGHQHEVRYGRSRNVSITCPVPLCRVMFMSRLWHDPLCSLELQHRKDDENTLKWPSKVRENKTTPHIIIIYQCHCWHFKFDPASRRWNQLLKFDPSLSLSFPLTDASSWWPLQPRRANSKWRPFGYRGVELISWGSGDLTHPAADPSIRQNWLCSQEAIYYCGHGHRGKKWNKCKHIKEWGQG